MNTAEQAKPDPAATIARMGLTVTSVFVPFSQSRNKGEKHPSLNWKISLQKDGRDILTTDYGAGSAHCPAYKASVRALGGPNSVMRQDAIKWECEHGYAAVVMEAINYTAKGKRLEPNALDVISSLVLDSSVLDSSGFEDWAGEFGYDTDSREAEKTYRACLEIALKLRNGIGEAALAELREAFQDY